MAKQTILLGTLPNDGTGDPIRTAFTKINANFTELYNAVVDGAGNTLVNGVYTATLGTNGHITIPGGITGVNPNLFAPADGAAVVSNNNGFNQLYVRDSDVSIQTSIDNEGVVFGTWVFNTDRELTLPAGGTITEGIVTSNPTIQLTPASPDVPSQKLVIKGGGSYDYTDNGININYYTNTAIVGDTLTFFINSPTYADQTLYWWIYPEGAGIASPGSGTVVLDGSSGIISFELDSDDNEFTLRVSPEANNYDPSSLGVESGLINPDAPTFDDDHHLHLTTGDLSETSIFLGTDDHNVRTTVNGGIEITTPNTTNNVWQFGSNGDLELPSGGGIVFDRANTTIRVGMGFHIASGEGVSIEAIDETDPDNLVYKGWSFSTDGSLTLPGSIVKSTTLKTAVNSDGAATAVTVTNNPNANWVNGTGVLANGINFAVAINDGVATVTVNSGGGGTGHFVGETFGPVPGSAFGGTNVTDDMYFEVTAISASVNQALDLTKSINKITPLTGGNSGQYTLADGVEGQIMHIVPAGDIAENEYTSMSFAHARWTNGNGVINENSDVDWWLPFHGSSQVSTIVTLIFTDGHWNLPHNTFD